MGSEDPAQAAGTLPAESSACWIVFETESGTVVGLGTLQARLGSDANCLSVSQHPEDGSRRNNLPCPVSFLLLGILLRAAGGEHCMLRDVWSSETVLLLMTRAWNLTTVEQLISMWADDR